MLPPMRRLIDILDKHERLVIGLMSGTSIDGVDAALVRITGEAPGLSVELLGFRTYPFGGDLKERIEAAFDGNARELCQLNFVLGEVFADAVLRLLEDLEVPARDVDLIGSPGQTIYHVPRAQEGTTSTLQIGEASVVAERTGIPVVCDFRTRDIAAGGEGAPLVPYADYVLFHQPGRVRACQNIGGIANVTVVPDTLQSVFAFDTGPGNMIIDQVARQATADPHAFDENGKLSALGFVDEGLLDELKAHPYYGLKPPRSTGREMFGRDYAQGLIEGYDPLRMLDLLATSVALTADTIAESYERFVIPTFPLDEVIVSGGGAHNKTLMQRLRSKLAPIPVRTLEELGLSSDAKEAIAFAILASAAITSTPGNCLQATGATHPVVLGKLVP
jgi:anhydro-N-acetylmuramic acid kinase